MKINRHILDNGLHVVHVKYPYAKMVALDIAYNVGSRDESPEKTGLAHLMEHLMFGGSANIADYDTPLQNAGGENNAWTNTDITNFYLTIPAQNVETGFWLESARMLSLAFNPESLEVQRNVVMEEFKQRYLNQPYGDTAQLIRAMAYKVHPYQWPTIGKDLSHIAGVTMDDVRDFFFRFYAPDNAVLAVTGNIEWDEVLRLADKWFGPIPYRNVCKPAEPTEPEQKAPRTLAVERHVPVDSLYMAFHMDGCKSPDYCAYDMLSDILSNGQSSRLTQHLVDEQKLFTSIDAYVYSTIAPGLLQIAGKLARGVDMAEAEAAVWNELDGLACNSVGDYELEKVKNKFESTQIFGFMNYQGVAAQLAWFELLGDVNGIDRQVDRYKSVSAEQLRQVAQRCFTHNNSSVLYYKSVAG